MRFDAKRRNLVHASALLLGAVWLTACGPEARADKAGQRVVADVILTVNNQSARAVQVTLESGTRDHPLGDVAKETSRSFSLPSELIDTPSELHLKALHGGAQPFRSDAFEVRRGQKVVWTFGETGRGTLTWQ